MTPADSNPIAAAALSLLLYASRDLDVADALVFESSTYSMLQAGPEHQRWLASRPPRHETTHHEGDAVRIARVGDVLRLTLARPRLRNAFNAAMREGLLDGLAVAAADPSIARVVIDGDGANFCSGGDLREFGTLADPASAHLVRVERSVGRAIHAVRDRVTVVVHGACVGAGVELPAFAARVVARPDATFRLPEVGMGLIPGAGGTVSLPRRIGRDRTEWLARSGEAVDAATALDWGLVDAVRDDEGSEEWVTT